MKLSKQRQLSRLNKAIEEQQTILALAYARLHELHHERGELLYAEQPELRKKGEQR